jgi:two-component sensor histidine kinase/CheY-like chemotaxis protein
MTEPHRILYIDDDEGLGRLMTRALALHGMKVQHVKTGQDGISLLNSQAFDAVALDHDLGPETGLGVLAAIRSLANPPPVIYVTGSDDVRVAVAALKSGAVDYVWKDVQGHYRELLVQSIASAIGQERIKKEKALAEEEAREGRERAETLLREVNHRVANSLALVASFAGLQANALKDDEAKRALSEMRGRITAIASIHRRLYTSADVRFVDMDAYIESLASDLRVALNNEAGRHSIHLDVKSGVRVPTDKAVSVGVLITELVTNAYKYAYPGDVAGDIRIRLEPAGRNSYRLVVEDDGVGWTGAGEPKGTGLGSRIIHAMASGLRSLVTYDPSHEGTRAVMEFEIQGDENLQGG